MLPPGAVSRAPIDRLAILGVARAVGNRGGGADRGGYNLKIARIETVRVDVPLPGRGVPARVGTGPPAADLV